MKQVGITEPISGPELDRMRRRLRSRANHLSIDVHPSQIARVRDSADVILGGRNAAQAAGAPIDISDKTDAYVRASNVEEIVREYAARPVSNEANLVL